MGYAALSDLKTREVHDWLWMLFLPPSAILLVFRLLLRPELIAFSTISIVAAVCISLSLSYVGLFGGADFKAFACLGLALPTHPFLSKTPLPSANPLFPIMVFYNMYLLSTCTLLYCLARNMHWKYKRRSELFGNPMETSPLRRFLALLTGYKTSFADLQTRSYLYPMEQVIQNNGIHRKLKFFVNVEENRRLGIESLGKFLSDSERDEVWVTPGIPLLLFAFLALLMSSFAGDVLFWIVSIVMSAIL